MENLETLKKSIEDWVGDLPHNKHKQELLSTEIYHLEADEIARNAGKIGKKAKPAEKPLELETVGSTIWNREKVRIHLGILKVAMDIARGPPPLILPGASRDANKARNIEMLQTAWMGDSKLREKVQAYRENLENALTAYNNQLVAARLRDVVYHLQLHFEPEKSHRIFGHQAWMKMSSKEAIDALSALESRFYGEGNSRSMLAGRRWEALQKHKNGRFFILTPEEEREGLKTIMSGKHLDFPEEE